MNGDLLQRLIERVESSGVPELPALADAAVAPRRGREAEGGGVPSLQDDRHPGAARILEAVIEGVGGSDRGPGHWRRSLIAAGVARRLACRSGLPRPERAFFVALLQDIGILLMSRGLGPRYDELVRRAPEHRLLTPLEQQTFDLDHAQVSGAVALRWRIPTDLCEAMRYHEAPAQARQELGAPSLPLINCVTVASLAADVLSGSSPGPALLAYLRGAESYFNLSCKAAERLLLAASGEAERVWPLFGLPVSSPCDAQAILRRGRDEMVEFALVCDQRCRELAEENGRLVRQASIDPLTGVANRRRFDQIMAEQFNRTLSEGVPLSLLFLDTDHLKEVNDRHGHLAGDRALIELADLLTRRVGDRGHVARYGGEEFAIVLPATGPAAAIRLARTIRRQITALALDLDGGARLRVTASIGVATHDGRCFCCVEQFLQAADRAMYAAKSAGRNSVRLFRSPPALVASPVAAPVEAGVAGEESPGDASTRGGAACRRGPGADPAEPALSGAGVPTRGRPTPA